MGYYYGPSWGFGLAGGLLWLLIIIAAIIIIAHIAQGPRRHLHGHPLRDHRSRGAALEILKERYVKGEITKDQFETIKRDIEE